MKKIVVRIQFDTAYEFYAMALRIHTYCNYLNTNLMHAVETDVGIRYKGEKGIGIGR